MTLQTQFPTTFFHTPQTGSPPVADFTYEDNGDQTISFTDISINTPTSWSWDFGDGSEESTEQHPTHTYESGGPHTVVLTATNAVGSSSDSQVVTVTLAPPIASFTYQDNGDLSATFTDASLPQASGTAIDTWSWDFGDSTGTSTEQNPTYTYAAEGNYSVTLTITDTYGNTDSSTEAVTIEEDTLPVAGYTYQDNGDQTVTFTDTSTNSPTNWSWNFGDGTGQSTEQNPTHIFVTAGPHTVVLTATNAAGSDTESKSVTVTLAPPTVSFTATDHNNLQVSFESAVTVNAEGAEVISWAWDFGDSSGSSELENDTYTYSASGTYSVTLTVTDSYGNQTIEEQDVVVSDPAELTYPSLGGTALQDVLYFWYAGDGTVANSTLGNVQDGGLVSSWTSEGSNTLQLTQTNVTQQPTFRLSVPELGGLSGLEFDGDWLFATVANSSIATLPAYTIHVLTSNVASRGGYVYTEGRNNNASHRIWTGFASSNLVGRHQGSTSATVTAGTYTIQQPVVISFAKYGASDYRLYKNGTQIGTSTSTPGTIVGINRITIGALITHDGTSEVVLTDLLGWVNTVVVVPNVDNVVAIANGLVSSA